jgi:quercetin dioxygenase-like cupin family protein
LLSWPSSTPILVKPSTLGRALSTAKTTALFKANDLEVVRLVLAAGRSLPPHQVPGEITIQCIEGSIDVEAEGQSRLLDAGQLLYLPGNLLHGATAVENASALVTVALDTWSLRASLHGAWC